MADTVADLHAHQKLAEQQGNAPLAEPFWIRTRDARDWLDEYRQVSAWEKRKQTTTYKARRNFVLGRLPHKPRYTYFPPADQPGV